MKLKWITQILLGILFLTGCATKVNFTNDIRNKIVEAGISLKTIQYFPSVKVILKRGDPLDSLQVRSGTIKEVRNKTIDLILLGPNTPGICTVDTLPDKLSIAFEEDYSKALDFGKWPADGNNNSPYQIYAIEWRNNVGQIFYDGKFYYIQPDGSQCKLMIKKSVLNKIKVNKRRMKGVRVGAG